MQTNLTNVMDIEYKMDGVNYAVKFRKGMNDKRLQRSGYWRRVKISLNPNTGLNCLLLFSSRLSIDFNASRSSLTSQTATAQKYCEQVELSNDKFEGYVC
jgi:hypothetical protein